MLPWKSKPRVWRASPTLKAGVVGAIQCRGSLQQFRIPTGPRALAVRARNWVAIDVFGHRSPNHGYGVRPRRDKRVWWVQTNVGGPPKNCASLLQKQWEATSHRRRAVKRARRTNLEATNSIDSFMPALSCMAGLSTEPHLMYKMTAFDSLHVCFFRAFHIFFSRVPRLCTSCYLCITLTPDWCFSLHCRPPSDYSVLPFTAQVLDQGVTRMIVHRLVDVFPYACAGDKPLVKSFAAGKRIGNRPFKQLGRRSLASKFDPGYDFDMVRGRLLCV